MSKIIKSHRVFYEDINERKKSEIGNEVEPDSQRDLIFEEIKNKKIEANKKAKEIIEEAEKDAKTIILEADYKAKKIQKDIERQATIVKAAAEKRGYDEGYSRGRDQGKTEGYKQGYEEGFEKGKTEADTLISEALEIKNQCIEDRNNMLQELEPEVIELVIDIYEKVLGKKMEEDRDYIVDLAISGIRSLDPTEKLTVIVSKDDFDIVEENKDKLLVEASLINELEIKYDINLDRGDCILETPKGDIDLGLNGQIEEINNTLRKILNNE